VYRASLGDSQAGAIRFTVLYEETEFAYQVIQHKIGRARIVEAHPSQLVRASCRWRQI
jgi:hypothetical protein